MKPILALVLSVLLLFSFAACAGQKTSADESLTENEYVINPIEEVSSPESFASLGVSIDAPADATNVRYSTISRAIAQVNFNVNNAAFTFRASKTDENIAGLYGDVVDRQVLDDGAVLTSLTDGEEIYRKITWKSGGVYYALTNSDGAGEDAILAVYDSLD